jgi:Zn-dependent protease
MGPVNHRGSVVRPGPVFLAIVAAFVLCGLVAWRYGQQADEQFARIALFGFVLAGWIVSLCLHEFGHAYFAYRSGDHSVATRGYLTLDPRKYADVTLSFFIPVLFILIGGIGLPGGAVWIDRSAIPGRLRHSLISAAGPIANALFAIALAATIATVAPPGDDFFATLDPGGHGIFWSGLYFLAFLQVTAALLNLLPIPGLDGFGIAEPYLPRHWVARANRYGGYVFLGLIALLWIPPINRAFFDAVFNLTDLLGVDRQWIGLGNDLFRFWQPVS